MKRQELLHRPAMVGDPCGHGRRRLLGTPQTLMRRAKVIDRPHQEHALVQRQGVAGQRPAPARQRREAFPERRVEPLYVGGVDHPTALRATSERLHACRRAIDKAAFRRDHPPPLVALDDLGDQDMAPRAQPWPSALPRVYGIAKGLPNSSDVGHQAIGAEQQRTVRRTAAHPLDQPPDQGQVTLLTDLTAQPQARRDHHGQRHPDNTALFLDAQLIGLHLSQVPWLFDEVFLHGLPLSPGACPPIGDCALVKPQRRYNRLHGTAMGEQGHDDHDRLGQSAQPIEDGAFASAEGFVTRMTDEALLLLRMDTDIALAGLASGGAMPVGAECGCGVHDSPPGFVWQQANRSMLDPHFRYKCASPRLSAKLPDDQCQRETGSPVRRVAQRLYQPTRYPWRAW